MTPLHGRDPAFFESPNSRPVHLVPLPSAPKRTKPETFDLVAEGPKALLVAGDSVVAEVSSDDLAEPSALLGDGLMAALLQLQLQLVQLGRHSLLHRPPLDLKLSVLRGAACMREPEEIEGLRGPEVCLLPSVHRKATELDEPCLLGM